MNGEQPDAALYQRLAAEDAAGRTLAVIEALKQDRDGRLRLPARDGVRAKLDDIDLSATQFRDHLAGATLPVPWWDAATQSLNLKGADLRGASLKKANLSGVALEEANFSGADLAGANLRAANLAAADFRGAMIEDANLRGASLRFAHLEGAVLEGAACVGGDLWGVSARGAELAGADLRDAVLEEADLREADLRGADLRGAVLTRANLRGANLEGANLQDAELGGTDLDGAVLREARLQELVLIHCRLAHVHLADAWLDRTRLRAEQLQGALGEELGGAFEPARRGYLALERNFETLGDPDAARWAYRKKRQMQKREAHHRARVEFRTGRYGSAVRWYLTYFGDLVAEWVCDYGESVPRVLASLVTVYVLFILLYGITGTVVRVEQGPEGAVKTTTYAFADLALFSLTSMTAPGNPPDWLLPRNSFAYLLAGMQALLSIFLTGLLGFVAGNRIRR